MPSCEQTPTGSSSSASTARRLPSPLWHQNRGCSSSCEIHPRPQQPTAEARLEGHVRSKKEAFSLSRRGTAPAPLPRSPGALALALALPILSAPAEDGRSPPPAALPTFPRAAHCLDISCTWTYWEKKYWFVVGSGGLDSEVRYLTCPAAHGFEGRKCTALRTPPERRLSPRHADGFCLESWFLPRVLGRLHVWTAKVEK